MKDRRSLKKDTPIALKIMGIASSIIVLASAIFVTTCYSKIPDTIPHHYGFNRMADGWGSKSILWYIVAGNVLLNTILAGSTMLPLKGINPSLGVQPDAPRINRSTAVWLALLRLLISLIFAMLTVVMALSVEKFPISLSILIILTPIVCGAYGIREVIRSNKENLKK